MTKQSSLRVLDGFGDVGRLCSCSINSDSVQSLSPSLVFGVACGGQLIIQVEHVDLVACATFAHSSILWRQTALKVAYQYGNETTVEQGSVLRMHENMSPQSKVLVRRAVRQPDNTA